MKARTLKLGGLTTRLVSSRDVTGDAGGGPLVVLLHGFGAPGDDLVGLAADLASSPEIARLPVAPRYLFPHAPLALGPDGDFREGEGEEGGGRAWWPIDMMAIQLAAMRGERIDRSKDIPPQLAGVRASVTALLDEAQRELGASGEQTVLGGFSQGSMVSCDVALQTDRPLAGLAVLSGTLLAEPQWGPRFVTRGSASPVGRKPLPVFMSHGNADPVLPFVQAEQLRDRFSRAGVPVRWVPFRGGHGIGPDALTALGSFIAGALSPA
jgi:phospholipase/carboxylesterase